MTIYTILKLTQYLLCLKGLDFVHCVCYPQSNINEDADFINFPVSLHLHKSLFPSMLVIFYLREWANYGSQKFDTFQRFTNITALYLVLISPTEKRKITVTAWFKGNTYIYILTEMQILGYLV